MVHGENSGRISLQRKTAGDPDAIIEDVSYVTYKIVWANWAQTGGNKTWDSEIEGDVNQFITTFTIRYFDGLLYSDQVLWNNDEYEIQSITPIGRRRGLKIVAERKENNPV